MIERLIISACVPLLLVIGYKLFMKGATGEIKIAFDSKLGKARAANLAPGGFCFFLACGLGVWIMSSPVTQTPAVEYDSGYMTTSASPEPLALETRHEKANVDPAQPKKIEKPSVIEKPLSNKRKQAAKRKHFADQQPSKLPKANRSERAQEFPAVIPPPTVEPHPVKTEDPKGSSHHQHGGTSSGGHGSSVPRIHQSPGYQAHPSGGAQQSTTRDLPPQHKHQAPLP